MYVCRLRGHPESVCLRRRGDVQISENSACALCGWPLMRFSITDVCSVKWLEEYLIYLQFDITLIVVYLFIYCVERSGVYVDFFFRCLLI